MPVPKYNEMYKVFLECLKDGKSHSIKEIYAQIATAMQITEEELAELLPSGKQRIFINRVGWTRTYLKKAGLIENPSRGVFILTNEGKEVLAENPTIIDDPYLTRYESFRQFKFPDNPVVDGTVTTGRGDDTPQDTLDKAYKLITHTLSEDLLSEIMKQSPFFFEELVVKLLEKMGYGGTLKDAGTLTQQTGDEGIDGIIKEDKLGFNLIYIQAKR